MAEPITGIILAGGQSARFGADKASALFRGEQMIQVVARALEPVCRQLVVVAAPQQELPTIKLAGSVEIARDAVAAQGPLEGMRAGLAVARSELVFVCGVDVPLLRTQLVAFVLSYVESHDAAVPRVDGHLQPLVAAYRRETSLVAVEESLDSGERAVAAALDRLDVRIVDEEMVRLADPELLSFRNANTQQELAELESLVVP